MTITHPDIGEWRAWLDQEAPSADLDRHLAECAGCQALLADLRDAAEYARGAVALLAGATPDAGATAIARERLARRMRVGGAASVAADRAAVRRSAWQRVSTTWRVAGTGFAAALALTLLVTLTPEGQTAAAGFLAQFRSQQVAAVEITPATQGEIMRTLNALGNLGTITTPTGAVDPGRPEAAARQAAGRATTVTLAEANQAVGFKLQTPDPATLPAGLATTPSVRVTPASQVRFTFDKDKALRYFQLTGHPEVDVPDRFNGAALVVSIPPAALLEYGNPAGGKNVSLVIGQAGELVVDAQGNVSIDQMRDFLLRLPGWPASTVNQLKNIKNWNQTLPIPIPVDVVSWQSARFKGGNQGLLLNDNSGVGSAAIWYENEHMIGVAGTLKATELKRIADSLALR